MLSYYQEAVKLLKELITISSVSREESATAEILESFLISKGCQVFRKENNVWSSDLREASLPVILLNSHHDTVKPSESWTRDPFQPHVEDGILYGLGSNDAGASLVSLLMTYLYLSSLENRRYNLIFAASAEEEVTGKNGLPLILDDLGPFDLAIVGEPTGMQMAIAEKGLMVLDGKVRGKTGHAARNEGDNAIYKAMQDIEWFRTFQFPKSSDLLGPVKMTVSMINAGYQHNIVPDLCSYVVDIRTNECYSNPEVLGMIREHLQFSEVTPRSTHLKSSYISPDHPLIRRGLHLGLNYYGSPTCSDQMRIPYPSLKMGPGDSARSHTADEYVYLKEIEQGISTYIALLEGFEF